MTNDNNTPKTASHMLFHELAANGGTKRDTRDIVDRLNTFTASNADWPTIADAAAEIVQLRARVDELERTLAYPFIQDWEYEQELEAARAVVQMEEKQYCDNCGAVVRGDETDTFVYGELPCDIASANKGESAVVCNACYDMIEANANNEYFKKNHR
jgi:hypothetical protein